MISLFSTLILFVMIIVYINNIDYAYGQVNETQSLQVNPGTITPQPLKDARTGVDQKFPGKLIGILDPNTGQIIAKEVQFVPPEVTGPSVVGSSQASGLFGTAPPETSAGGFGSGAVSPGVIRNEVLGSELLFGTNSPVLNPGFGGVSITDNNLPSISEY